MKSFLSLNSRSLYAILICAALFICGSASAQTSRGKVVDQNGTPIIGASVIAQGTTNGVVTNVDGTFEIKVAPNTTLEVACLGYVTKTVAASSNMSIVLTEDATVLAETVVVGYGTMKKTDVTGAMVRVDSEQLTTRPTNNVLEAMQGKAAGVDIRTNERPGEVGSVFIRGQRSINASSSPLYVVDGIPMQSGALEAFNPNDIESIDILKDASATAIYGSRGANGVVLVTTKKGTKDKMTISYNGSLTVEDLVSKTQWMNSDQYITWRRYARYYSDPKSYASPKAPTYANDYNIFNGGSDPYAWRNIEKGWSSDHSTWTGGVPTTDWFGLILKTSVTQEHTVSASGGTDKMQSYLSFGYLNNQGTIKGQGFERYTIKANNDFKPYKWIAFGANLTTTYSIQNYGLSGAGNFQGGAQSDAYGVASQGYPYAVPFDDEGNRIEYPGGDSRIKNVYGEWDLQTDTRKTLRAMGSIYAQLNFDEFWEPLKGLSYRVNFGPDFRYYNRGLFVDASSFNRSGSNYALNGTQKTFSWTLDNIISYNRTFGKHNIGATLLHSASAYNNETTSMDAENLPLPSAKWNNMGSVSALRGWDTGLTQTQMESYMARVNYSFNDRYMLTASVRRDGASQLAAGHKWATFPSVALGWRLDREDFMSNIPWVDQLKLRAGYGVTGNAAISAYQTKGAIAGIFYPFGDSITSAYTLFDSMLSSSTDRSLSMANENLTWEKTAQYNVGLDFSFLNGRVNGVFDVYKSYTRDLLMKQSIPALLGYTTTYNNIGKTENFGYDITLNLVPVRTTDWEWEVDINAAYTKNKITELSNGKEDDIANGWFIGQSIGAIYTYQSAGLWQAEDAEEMAKFNANGNHFEVGMARPVDQNGDHKIDANYDRVIVGCTMPLWTMGINTSLSWKSWTIAAQLYGRFGFKDYGSDAPWVGGRYTVRNYDYWTEDNTGAKYTKPIYSEAGLDSYYQIVDIRDRSYMKIRNISLTYSVPSAFLKKTSISGLKLYVQAKNLGSIFNGSEARDMDTGLAYYNRGFTFGANISF